MLVAFGQPLEPARQVPVGLAEQLHRGRQEHAADERGVDQDGERETDAHLLEIDERERDEHQEHSDHHERGARDRARPWT